MKSNLYTIHDAAAEYFMPPFVAATDNLAKRMFITSMGDAFAHRSDFVLFRVGTFDSETGLIDKVEPTSVLGGMSVDPRLDPRVNQEITQ